MQLKQYVKQRFKITMNVSASYCSNGFSSLYDMSSLCRPEGSVTYSKWEQSHTARDESQKLTT